MFICGSVREADIWFIFKASRQRETLFVAGVYKIFRQF